MTTKGEGYLEQAEHILDLLVKIQESSDSFPVELEGIFKGISLLEVHCIAQIGLLDYANVTRIARTMNLTRGGVSKICKRMAGKGLIEGYQRPNNNKEICYRLTGAGRKVYIEHEKIHNKARQEEMVLLGAFNESEQAVILRFLSGVYQLHN